MYIYIKTILILWLLGSFIGLLFFSHQHFQFHSTKTWNQTSAKIIESNLSSSKGGGVTKNSPRYISYDLKVIYDYRIKNKSYRSSNVYYPIKNFKPFGGTTSFEFAREMLLKYEKGATVNSYYNPKIHSQSVLINKAPRGNIFIPIIFLLFFALGIFNLYRYNKFQLK